MAVRIHIHQLEQAERYLASIPNGARIAAARAINRAMQAAKTMAAKSATENYTVKRQKVVDKIRTSTATQSNLVARVVSRGRALKLSDYQTRPGRPGGQRKPKVLKANVLRSTGFQPIKGAFLTIGNKTGQPGVFGRIGKERYPIKQYFGPSIPEILGSKNVSEAIESRANDVLGDRFNHEVARLMRQGLGR